MTENQSNKRQAPVLRANVSHEAFESILAGTAQAYEIPHNKKAVATASRFCVERAVYWYRKGLLPDPHFRAEFTDIDTGEVVRCQLDYSHHFIVPETGEEAYLIPFAVVNDVPIERTVVTVTSARRRRTESRKVVPR